MQLLQIINYCVYIHTVHLDFLTPVLTLIIYSHTPKPTITTTHPHTHKHPRTHTHAHITHAHTQAHTPHTHAHTEVLWGQNVLLHQGSLPCDTYKSSSRLDSTHTI